jgi:hypothetical protein
MLALILYTLFAIAMIAAFVSLADSYVRGWNAYRDLRHAAGEAVAGTRITFVSLSDQGALPGLRRGDCRGRRYPAIRRLRATRAAA